jgi:hypothetical protein
MVPTSSGSLVLNSIKKSPLLDILSPISIKKFTSIYEVALILIPTTLGYFTVFETYFNIPTSLTFIALAIIFVLLYIISLRCKKTDYEKTIAEVLETGYFNNFLDKTASFISTRKDDPNHPFIRFNFSDGTSEPVKVSDIKVKVILPQSLKSLDKTMKVVGRLTQRGSLDNGTWVLYKKESEGKITIYDYPRTMKTMGDYLKTREYNEQKSEKLHKMFNDKFEDDWGTAGETLKNDIFTKIKIHPSLQESDLLLKLTEPMENEPKVEISHSD